MRRLLILFAATIAAALGTMRPASAEIGSYLLFDMETGEVIARHEPVRPWYPASLTKLMTAYVTFEAIADGELKLTSPVRISPQAARQPPSRMGFALGTVLPVETALRIILTKSANDVSVALAEAVGGTQQAFEARMNRVAARLGMSSTRFENPHGLPNRKQMTTARDMALLMMALARDFPDRADFFTMSGVLVGDRRLRNFNVLITRFDGADGMKTGFICAAGFNLAATATRDGTRLGAVVLGGLTSRERDERTAELLEKGFEALASGGVVALDGFGAPEARPSRAPVSGERPPLGTVADLEPLTDAEPANRRDAVCGAERPSTRYDDGTVASVAAFDAQRAAFEDWQRQIKARAQARARTLSETPLSRPSIAPALGRRAADDRLAPDGWHPTSGAAVPSPHPTRAPQHGGRGTAEAAPAPQALAPDGWPAAAAFPIPNPLAVAGLTEPPPPRPQVLPLSYLGSRRSVPYVRVTLGGADAERPEPLSGSVVGGGPAPVPRAKPLPAVFPADSDPDTILEHVDAVRAEAGPPRDP